MERKIYFLRDIDTMQLRWITKLPGHIIK